MNPLTLTFLPGLDLAIPTAPFDVSIKGAKPQLAYSTTLIELYPFVPALPAVDAFRTIRKQLERMNDRITSLLCVPAHYLIPSAKTDAEAIWLFKVLFNPTCASVDRIVEVAPVAIDTPGRVFHSVDLKPFPFLKAGKENLLHTLNWVDGNIKVTAEQITSYHSLPTHVTIAAVETALTIYAILLKMQDFQLAAELNFNHSIFLQERILQLIFGDDLYSKSQAEIGTSANAIALDLLATLGPLSMRELCELSVFMGVVWTSVTDLQRAYGQAPTPVVTKLLRHLERHRQRLVIDHIQQLCDDIARGTDAGIVFILDDNGESVFDLAIVQHVLAHYSQAHVALIVNRFAVSTNLSLATLRHLLRENCFVELRRCEHAGRLEIVVEEQMFRSFEVAYLSLRSRVVMAEALLVYIKGVNFFETCQLVDCLRYYCFTVTGRNCVALTGCPEGAGVVARVPVGVKGYEYIAADQIWSLTDVVSGYPSTGGKS